MGEATFTKPIMEWLAKRRARKSAKLERSAVEAEPTLVRDTLVAGGAPEPEPAREATFEPEPQERETEPAAEPERLPDDLIQNVFRRGPSSQEQPRGENGPGAESETGQTGPVAAEAPTGEETPMSFSTPEPQVSQINRVSIESSPQEEPGGAQEPWATPVQHVSAGAATGEDVAEGSPAVRVRQETSSKGPEPQPGTGPSSPEAQDSLPFSVKDIFQKKVVANPHVKALLRRHGTVDANELADELRKLTAEIDAKEQRS